jgi:transposase-like protein
MADAIRQIGVSEVTYYRWRQEFGGLKIEQIKRLKELEVENSRLRVNRRWNGPPDRHPKGTPLIDEFWR